jgi:hypothetical protein
VEIDKDTESVLFGPFDGSDNSCPRVDIGGGDRFEGCTLAVGGTERPVSDGEADGIDT